MRQQLRTCDGAGGELLVPLAPRLFAVTGEEVGEAGAEIASHVPADGDDRIAAARARRHDLAIGELGDRAFGERLVTHELAGDRLDDRAYVGHRSLRVSGWRPSRS